jgi:HSP20 family protein
MKLALRNDPFNWMNRVFNNDDNWVSDWNWTDENQLDMWEEEDKIHVKVKAPDFEEKDIDISVENNVLTITGKKEEKVEEEDKKKKFYRREFSTRSFTRSVSLPTGVAVDKAEAKFKNGVLKLVMPKTEEAKPKKITVRAE